MGKIIGILLATATLCGCNGIRYTVTGTLEGACDSVYLVTLASPCTTLASAAVTPEGSFTIKGRITEPIVAQIIDMKNTSSIIFLEQGDIFITTADRGGCKVSGTVSNDRFDSLNKRLGEIRTDFFALGPDAADEERDALRDNYNAIIAEEVTANTDNILGVYLFHSYEYEGMKAFAARRRLEQFSDAMRKTELLRRIDQKVATEEKSAVGEPYIELSLPDTAGVDIPLSSAGIGRKWVLIDFRAIWNEATNEKADNNADKKGNSKKSSNKKNGNNETQNKETVCTTPQLRELFAHYKDKGFAVYGIWLDNDITTWRLSMGKQALPWLNVIGTSDGCSIAAKKYGLRSAPTNILIAPDGRIAARNIGADSLKICLTKHLQ